jgi:hypothetical protein
MPVVLSPAETSLFPSHTVQELDLVDTAAEVVDHKLVVVEIHIELAVEFHIELVVVHKELPVEHIEPVEHTEADLEEHHNIDLVLEHKRLVVDLQHKPLEIVERIQEEEHANNNHNDIDAKHNPK